MPKARSTSAGVKRKGRPPKKKLRDEDGKGAGTDDLDYMEEESDQSFGEDELDTLSDGDSVHRGKKRGRGGNKAIDKSKRQAAAPMSTLTALASPSQDPDSDHDEIGETKVDSGGNLLGGRQYKVPTFSLPTRGNKLFMFSKDPAALLGFRDSFVFMKKNPKLVKVHITDAEKGYLVQRNQMRSTFRTREISVVTARSVFKQFGHRVIKKGRKGRDDYYYTGEEEGDSDDISADEGKDASNDSWSPMVSSRNNLTKRKLGKDVAPVVNEVHRLHHVALSIRNFNTQICEYRRDNPSFYDINTRVHQIPSARQPLRLLYEITEKPITDDKKEETAAPAESSTVLAGAAAAAASEQQTAAQSAPTTTTTTTTPASAPAATAAATIPTTVSATTATTTGVTTTTAAAPPAIRQYPLQQAQMRPGHPFALHQFQQQQQQMALRRQMASVPQAQQTAQAMYYQQQAMRPPGAYMSYNAAQQQALLQQQQQQQQQQMPGQSMPPQNGIYTSMGANNPYSYMHSGTM